MRTVLYHSVKGRKKATPLRVCAFYYDKLELNANHVDVDRAHQHPREPLHLILDGFL